jgi:hypothetical protein
VQRSLKASHLFNTCETTLSESYGSLAQAVLVSSQLASSIADLDRNAEDKPRKLGKAKLLSEGNKAGILHDLSSFQW